jgi:hypothetical protein
MLLVLTSCTSKETKALLEPSQALGTVLAEEAVRAAGSRKQVILIVPQWGGTCTVGESLKTALRKQGLTALLTLTADVGDPMGRGALGVKPDDFSKALEQAAGVGIVVSLAGAPLLTPEQAAQLSPQHPPVLVVATASLGNVIGVTGDRRRLESLLEARAVQLAIVDGAPEPAAPPAARMDSARELFSQHYRILRRPD